MPRAVAAAVAACAGTFQTIATRAPQHAPRLTVADRRYAELGTVAWTRELPRDAHLTDARVDAAVDALLGFSPDLLSAAHAEFAPAGGDLLAEVERLVRGGALFDAMLRGDAAAAWALVAAATEDADALLARVLVAFTPQVLGDALANSLTSATIITALLRQEAQVPNAAAVLDAALAASDRVRWGHDGASRDARGALALAAARRGDGERFVRLADVDGPWEQATPVRSGPARLTTSFANALARASTVDGAVAALDALAALELSESARRDAATLALAIASRALGDATPDGLRRLSAAILACWERMPPADARGDAVRRLLGGGAPSRAIAELPATERAGWTAAAVLRALDTRGDVAFLGTIDEAAQRALGTLLAEAAPDGPPMHGAWPALLAQLDAVPRRTVLVRALGRAVALQPLALGELATTCAALAELDVHVDVAAARELAPSVARWHSAPSARLEAALALLASVADADAAATLVTAALRDAPEDVRALVRLRRLAVAIEEVEATRDPSAWATLRAALVARGATLLPAQRATLRAFFGVSDGGGLFGRFRRRGEDAR